MRRFPRESPHPCVWASVRPRRTVPPPTECSGPFDIPGSPPREYEWRRDRDRQTGDEAVRGCEICRWRDGARGMVARGESCAETATNCPARGFPDRGSVAYSVRTPCGGSAWSMVVQSCRIRCPSRLSGRNRTTVAGVYRETGVSHSSAGTQLDRECVREIRVPCEVEQGTRTCDDCRRGRHDSEFGLTWGWGPHERVNA